MYIYIERIGDEDEKDEESKGGRVWSHFCSVLLNISSFFV